jgi:protoporphyrinogen/coproporphyrinogen III oxidase
MTGAMPGRLVVVGGGISGLAAAWELTGGGEGVPTGSAAAGAAGAPEVIVLEASERLGGALRSEPFGGRTVDMGPDGFLGRRPEAVELCQEVGLGETLAPIGARGASVWARGRLRPLPERLALGIPTRFWPTARSGTLGLRGQLGLMRDALLPRPDVRGPMGDRSIGPLVARKLGQSVVDVLVDPVIGGIHAGSVDNMSAAAVFPPLLDAAQRRGGLMRALRAEVPTPDPEGTPLFWSPVGGMAALVHALRAALRARNVDLRLGTAADALERGGEGWTVRVGTESLVCDGVVLSTPAPVTAALLRPHDDEAAGLLDAIDYASVVLVTFVASADDVPVRTGTGFLVPRAARPPKGRDPWSLTACTYLDQKWPHLAREDDVLLRASLGRANDPRPSEWSDAEVIERAWEELGALMGGSLGVPKDAVVVRHPSSFPQYRVHHLLRTAAVEAAAARLGGLAVAGAAYRGVGIPACIGSGRAAARALL